MSMSPEEMQALQQPTDPNQGQQQPRDPNQQDPNQWQDPFNGQAMTGSHPDAALQDQADMQIDPMELLPELIVDYIDYAVKVKEDGTIGHPVKSKTLSEMATAISTLVSLLQNDGQAQQAELMMKAQQHALQLQQQQEKHQAEMQQSAEKHQLEMAKLQAHLEGDAIRNTQGIIHAQQQHETKIQQQKQAAQLKQSQKGGNDGANPKPKQ